MYKDAKSKVKFNNKVSDEFSCMTGVRQGECLSPKASSPCTLMTLRRNLLQRGLMV